MTEFEVHSGVIAVQAAIAPLLGEPRISGALCSQLLAGETLTVHEQLDEWVRVEGEDHYTGWTHAGYLTRATGDEARWRFSLGCEVRQADGGLRRMPLGARIAPTSQIVHGECVEQADRAGRFARSAEAIATSAAWLFAGASYVWGAVTPWGCDCSGFVQRVFALHGVSLPRDAWQQAGTQADRSPKAAASAGDHHPASALLFFSDRDDRRVTHVGIALGDGRMVHSALSRGGVAIEQMDGNDAYVERLRAHCIGVRRVL